MAEKLTLKVTREGDVLTIYGAVEYAEQQPINALWMAYHLGKTGNPAFYRSLYDQPSKVEHSFEATDCGVAAAREIVEAFTPDK